jgi:hypothetical protein
MLVIIDFVSLPPRHEMPATKESNAALRPAANAEISNPATEGAEARVQQRKAERMKAPDAAVAKPPRSRSLCRILTRFEFDTDGDLKVQSSEKLQMVALTGSKRRRALTNSTGLFRSIAKKSNR